MRNVWQKYKKIIYIIALFSATSFLLGIFAQYHLPRLKEFALIKIESLSAKHSPIRVWPQKIEFHLLPVGVTLYDVKLLPKKDLADKFEPAELKSIDVRLSTWSLLKGQFKVGRILISGGHLKIVVPKSQGPAAMDFSLDQFPLDRIALENVSLDIKLQDQKIDFSVANLNLFIESKYQSIRTTLQAQKLKLIWPEKGIEATATAEAKFLIDKEGLYFSHLSINHKSSTLSATGAAIGKPLKGQFSDFRGKMTGSVEMEDVNFILSQLKLFNKTPKFAGQLRLETDFDFKNIDNYRTGFAIDTKNFKIDQYNIGNINMTGKSDQNSLTIAQAIIKNFWGSIQINPSHMNYKNNLSFDANLAGNKLDLRAFLRAIGLPNIPVYTTLNATTQCKGTLSKDFLISCNARASSDQLKVTTKDENSFAIVAFKNYEANGTVSISKEAVKYKSNLRIGSSHGESSGDINYATGFKINYSTPALNFADVSELASLKPEGIIALNGNTIGTSKYATIAMQAKGEKLFLTNYGLGRAQFDLKYKAGHLYIDKMNGQAGNTQYQANTAIDLLNKRITLEGQSPFIDAQDLVDSFSRKVQLPFTVTGTGAAKIKLNGPLQFNLLSYELSSSLFRGTIAGESYDQIQFHVSSKEGYVASRNISLTKGRSQIKVDGNVRPDGIMNLSVLGRNFQIEQSENLSRLKLNIAGNLNFDMFLSDYILKPKTKLLGKLTQMTVGDQPAQDSTIQLNWTDKALDFEGHFFGESVVFNLTQNQSKSDYSRLKIKTTDWNFAQIFSIFSESVKSKNYLTSLSSDLNLEIPNKNPFLYSGTFNIEKVLFKNGKVEMTSPKPLQLVSRAGVISTSFFELTGDDTYLRIKSNQQSAQNLNLTIEGRIDLTLATLITPFLDDIRGLSSFSLNITGPYEKPAISGSSYLQDALFKFKGFPHPLEQVSGDALFNKDKIIINSTKGRIGGGIFSGNGRIQFIDYGKVDVDIRGQFSDAKFNVPEGFVTRGNGDIYFHGQWFPYTLGVNYHIDTGNIDSKQNNLNKQTSEIKPSTFLPKSLGTQRTAPIHLELDVNFPKPIPVRMQMSQVEVAVDVYGQMKVNGPPDSPLMSGLVNINRGGKITVRNNIFEVRNGQLEYNKSKPENPTLNIDSLAKVTAQYSETESRDYDISMRVQGTAASPKITMTSEPALPEADLISLLTLGFINQTASNEIEDKNSSSGKLTSTSYQLGSAFINEQLGINRVLRDRLGVKFDYNTSYSAEDKAEKHKFQFTKQWTPKFGTSASREIGKTNTNNVKAEYKLNKRLSVIGQWEGNENTGTDTTTNKKTKDENVFGFDIEYKVDFK